MRKLVAGAILLVLAVAGGVGAWWVWKETRSKEVLGSSTVEFVTTQAPEKKHRPRKLVLKEPWPTYGYDLQRTHVAADYDHRPPFRRLWRLRTGHFIEYPPVVAYGRAYLAQVHGNFLAVNPETGRILWDQNFRRCTAASPTVWRGLVLQAVMYPLPCRARRHGSESRSGFVVAMDALSGKKRWIFRAGAIESSLLVVNGRLFFGSWDRHVYALNARTGKLIWSRSVDARVTSSPAYLARAVYIGTDGGRLYALDARTGRVRWRASSFTRLGRREFFYATPAVAYGRVFVGNSDGIVYSFGATSGRLLWAQRAGTYVYTAAAVWRRTVYVGTFDGWVVAFDAATGRRRWRYDAPGSIIGAPTVMGGLIYFSICGTCGRNAERRVEFGRPRTFALDARTGKLVWQFLDGKYSPIVADSTRVYLVGRTWLYGLQSKATARRLAERRTRRRRSVSVRREWTPSADGSAAGSTSEGRPSSPSCSSPRRARRSCAPSSRSSSRAR